jgi:ABC-type Mn2+/Zn2+ transport system ATPase subunit
VIIDDFALKAMDHTETADFYELIVERHQKTATILTSNRDASEWIGLMSDPLLAQSAVDRLGPPATNSSSTESPTAADNDLNTPPTAARRIDQKDRIDEHHHAAPVVLRSWQSGGPITLASDN